jgi:hypothetical protein
VKDLRNPEFAPRTVDLADEFIVNDGSFEAKKPFLFCTECRRQRDRRFRRLHHLLQGAGSEIEQQHAPARRDRRRAGHAATGGEEAAVRLPPLDEIAASVMCEEGATVTEQGVTGDQ